MPACRVTGPLGDGEVRDMVAALDIGVHWGRLARGGRAMPAHQIGRARRRRAFVRGRRLFPCALENALIAADARGRLGGGFAIQALSLAAMAGPEAQPAHLSAQRVTGRFGGCKAMRLALTAEAPALRIDESRSARSIW